MKNLFIFLLNDNYFCVEINNKKFQYKNTFLIEDNYLFINSKYLQNFCKIILENNDDCEIKILNYKKGQIKIDILLNFY